MSDKATYQRIAFVFDYHLISCNIPCNDLKVGCFGKIVFNDTTWMTREADHIREWIRSATPQNDTVIITGSAHGINVLGQEYSRNITEPLVLVHCQDYKWRWVIVDGTVEITNSVTGASTIDYSAEGCDGTVIVNKNGYRHNYEFRYNHRHHKHGGR